MCCFILLAACLVPGCSCNHSDNSGETLESLTLSKDEGKEPGENTEAESVLDTLAAENVSAADPTVIETLPESTASESEETPAASAAPESTAAPQASVPLGSRYPLWSDPNGGQLSENGRFPNYQALPNNSVPYGNDWDNKDAVGLPTGVHYYESLYGGYHPVYYINTADKVLYITMDEGYEAGYTPRILDILKEKNVHAVFFLTKQFVDSDPALVQRMIDEGHILGNHTCLHPSGGYPNYVAANGVSSFIDDVKQLHKMIYDQFGYSMQLFRFPEGEASEMLMAELDNLGYTSVFWSYAHKDYVLDDQPDPAVTLERCISHMAPGAVYLLHAVSSSNTEALGPFIDQARAAGYTFGDFPAAELSAW